MVLLLPTVPLRILLSLLALVVLAMMSYVAALGWCVTLKDILQSLSIHALTTCGVKR